MEATANFLGNHNLGIQLGQNFGTVINNFITRNPSECHQLFRLASTASGGYEFYKTRVEERVAGTCEWFLKHQDYQSWMTRSSGPLLVSADPGCGKSVLAKFLIDHELRDTVCYFFFQEEDQNTLKQALCALLHQLFAKHPDLLATYAIPSWRENGLRLVDLTDVLWDILLQAAQDTRAGTVTFVLDALDECKPSDLKDLCKKVTRYYLGRGASNSKVKFLLTSRPYQEVVAEFWELAAESPQIQIPGEKYSKEIEEEVNHVIDYRISRLAKKFKLDHELKSYLEERFRLIPQRTYLWTYLIFDILEKGFKKTRKGIADLIEPLPESVNQAYERILQRSTNPSKAYRTLSILLVAARPMTLREMNTAMHIRISPATTSMQELDLEDDEEGFKDALRDWCGLLISIHDGRIHLLHLTAREYLLAGLSPRNSQSWQGTIDLKRSHSLLAQICTVYINFNDFEKNVAIKEFTDAAREDFRRTYAFFEYSAFYLAHHFQSSDGDLNSDILPLVLAACCEKALGRPYWFQCLQAKKPSDRVNGIPLAEWMKAPTSLMIACFLGLTTVVDILLLTENVSYRNKEGRTALHIAAIQGNESVVRTLLEHDIAVINIRDEFRQTALDHSAIIGREAIVRLLLEYGANPNSDNRYGSESLAIAADAGYKEVVRLLLEAGARNEAEEGALEDYYREETALHLASTNGDEAIVRELIKYGAKLNERDYSGRTALHRAIEERHVAIARILLEHDAKVDIVDDTGTTPLVYALEEENEAIVRLLLEHGAAHLSRDGDTDYNNGKTALHLAARWGLEAIVSLLFEHGADLQAVDDFGQTPVHQAAEGGHESIVRLLLDRGAEINVRDRMDRSPLSRAVKQGHKATAQLLLDRGAEKLPEDKSWLRCSVL